MDIYKDGYIYTDVQTNRKMAIISFCKKYPCPQPHPDWEDGEDVTGKYMVLSDGSAIPLYEVVPIHTEQPTVKGVDVNGDEYPRLPLDAPTEQPSGIVLGKVERLNPDGSKTLISDGYSEQPKEQDYLNQKNIDFAAEAVAESVFYHYQDSTQKGKLKTALKMFANILLQQPPKH